MSVLEAVGFRRRRSTALVAAFIRRDWAIARSYRVPFVVDLVQSFMSLLLVYFLAKLVDGSKALAGTGSAGYFGFAAIGLSVLGVLTTSLVAFANRLRTDQVTGTIEAVMATPTPQWVSVVASASYDLLYSLVSAGVVLMVAVFAFGLHLELTATGAVVGAAAFVVALAGFASFGIVYAAFVVVFKRGQNALGLVGGGLSVFSGAYFPVRLLPGPLRAVADVLPITRGIAVLRAVLLEGQAPWGQVGFLAVSALVLLPASLAILDAALAKARRQGTLGQY